MTEPLVPLEAYVVTPGSVMSAAKDALMGNEAARYVIQALAESIIAIGRKPKGCMLGCGKRMGEVKGERAPAAFCILIPMFPFSGRHTDRAIASPICIDCLQRENFLQRLKQVLATEYECSGVRDVVKQ